MNLTIEDLLKWARYTRKRAHKDANSTKIATKEAYALGQASIAGMVVDYIRNPHLAKQVINTLPEVEEGGEG